jgi:hypothetical protein
VRNGTHLVVLLGWFVMLGWLWAFLGLSDSRISRLCLGRRDLDSLGIFWITDTGAGASIAVGAWAIAWAVGWVGCDIGWFVATGFGFGFGLWLGLRLGFADVVFLWWFVVVVVMLWWWTIFTCSGIDSRSVCRPDGFVYLHNNDLVFLALFGVFADALEALVLMALGLIVVVVPSGFIVRSCRSKASHCSSEGKEDE